MTARITDLVRPPPTQTRTDSTNPSGTGEAQEGNDPANTGWGSGTSSGADATPRWMRGGTPRAPNNRLGAPGASTAAPQSPPAAASTPATRATAAVDAKVSPAKGPDAQAVLRSFMQRGDAARELQGTQLINELGTALLLQPNNVPKTPAEEKQVAEGSWPFFTGNELSAVQTVRASILKVSGGKEPVNVTTLPVLVTDLEKKTVTQVPLFRVDGPDGKTKGFVDNTGRQYLSFEAWKSQNKLPAAELTYPAGGKLVAATDGLPKTVTENSHAVIDTTYEHLADWAEKVGTVAGFVVGGAAIVGVGGIAIPLAGAALAIGFGGKAVAGLVDAAQHGETLNPVTSGEARSNWLTAVASVAGLGASAATMTAVREIAETGKAVGALSKAAPGLTVGSQVLGTAQTVDGAVSLSQSWESMGWKDRLYATAQMAFFSASTVHAARQAGGLKNLYSVDAVRRQLNMPAVVKEGAPAADAKPTPSLLADRKTVRGALAEKNFFLEETTSAKPTSELISKRAVDMLNDTGPLSFDGRLGRLNAARFINRESRLDGDFRLAYGEQAYRAWGRADQELKSIPKGQLARELDIELLARVNKLAYSSGEDSALAELGHVLRAAQGHEIQGGVLRDYESRSLPFKMTPEDADVVRSHGVDVSTVHVGDVGEVALVYPDHTQIRDRLNTMLGDVQTALNNPNADVVQVGSNFVQKFVALHPFRDGNGRTARLVLDRVLAERDIPPPIFRDMGDDITMTTAQYEGEVRAGIQRTIQAVDGIKKPSTNPHDYLTQVGGVEIKRPKISKVIVDGEAYTQGSDGFVYNTGGRPHLIEDGVLQPLSQMEHYAIARRIGQAKNPKAELDQLTAATRALFERASMGNDGARTLTAASELPALAADNRFELHLPAKGNDRLLRLYDMKTVADPAKLFTHTSGEGSTTKTFVMSRHAQIDLEMWHVQTALTKAGDKAGAANILQQREVLFGLAKERLQGLAPKDAKTDNPLGFEKRFEKLAYEQSTLSFPTLKEAIAARGDDTIRVWRGDVIMSSSIGMHPDYSPMNPDANQLANYRQAKNGTAFLVSDLGDVAGSSLGTGYLCYTTDLKLLNSAGGFAEKFNPVSLNVEALPQKLRDVLQEKLPKGETVALDSLRDVIGIGMGRGATPKGKVNVEGVAPEVFEQLVRTKLPAPEAAKLVERFNQAHSTSTASPLQKLQALLTDEPLLIDISDVPSLSGYQGDSFLSSLATARDAIQLRMEGKTIEMKTARRAFLVEMDKSDAMPGPGTLGRRSFENEQEVTGLGKIAPWRILEGYRRAELDVDLNPKPPEPVPAAATPAATTPAATTPSASATPEVGPTQPAYGTDTDPY